MFTIVWDSSILLFNASVITIIEGKFQEQRKVPVVPPVVEASWYTVTIIINIHMYATNKDTK